MKLFTALNVIASAVLLTFATVSINGDDVDCNGMYKDQNSCNNNDDCVWCTAKAVPSECLTKEQAKQVPPGVFTCDSKQAFPTTQTKQESGKLDVTMERKGRSNSQINKMKARAGLGGTKLFEISDDQDEEALCDPNVRQIAGYFRLEEQDKHYFFWFFEARNKNDKTPFTIWMTGGPGCSSGVALFHENGPCTPTKNGTETVLNPNSWNEHSHMLFIDQPAGTGFSYGTHDTNEEQVGKDMTSFIREFMTKYQEYQSAPLHIFGESYGGHYVPAVSHEIWKQNQNEANQKINLAGIGIGNGLTDVVTQVKYYADMAKESGRVNDLVYKFMKTVSTPAAVAAVKACNTIGSTPVCAAAQEVYSLGLMIPYVSSGYNVYDYSKKCEKPPLCYDFNDVETYLNDEKVQKTLGVTKSWTSCDRGVQLAMIGDFCKNYQQLIPDLLENGITVTIYAGDLDYICNHLGNKAWTLELEWSGKEGYNAASDDAFVVNGKKAGEIRAYKGFSFIRVYDAGHMVPMDQPEAALALFRKFTE